MLLLKKIKLFFSSLVSFFRIYSGQQAISSLEGMYSELVNIFSVIAIGSFVGLPVPASITIRLIPLLNEDIKHMIAKANRLDDEFGDLFGILNMEA
ncbi:MAG: hypothetical protein QW333_00220 [Fervidicoccaceae archaeon]